MPPPKRTPEQYKASAAKAVATRLARIAEEEARFLEEEKAAASEAVKLRHRINELQAQLNSLQKLEAANKIAATLTGKALLSHEEIVKGSAAWAKPTGVYFLIEDDEVVYVGQSANVYSRLASHPHGQRFSRFAFVPCRAEHLDKLESLYIHYLRPRLNKDGFEGAKFAPIALTDLLGADFR